VLFLFHEPHSRQVPLRILPKTLVTLYVLYLSTWVHAALFRRHLETWEDKYLKPKNPDALEARSSAFLIRVGLTDLGLQSRPQPHARRRYASSCSHSQKNLFALDSYTWRSIRFCFSRLSTLSCTHTLTLFQTSPSRASVPCHPTRPKSS
jgi:hypothetical protein